MRRQATKVTIGQDPTADMAEAYRQMRIASNDFSKLSFNLQTLQAILRTIGDNTGWARRYTEKMRNDLMKMRRISEGQAADLQQMMKVLSRMMR
jgi:hypothetical protein